MTDTSKSFVLPENFKAAEDGSLQAFLQKNAAAPVRIDAGKLRRLDTLLVELLLSAAAAWSGAGLTFEVVNVSGPNADMLALLGLTTDHLTWRSAA